MISKAWKDLEIWGENELMPSPLRDITPSQITSDLWKFVIRSSFVWGKAPTTMLLRRLGEF